MKKLFIISVLTVATLALYTVGCKKFDRITNVETIEPTDITGNTATLKALLIDVGDQKTVGIDYGTTPAPTTGSEATATKQGDEITVSVKDLQLGTKYYVRAYSKNGGTKNYGKELSFTTLSIPAPLATTLAATQVAQTTATLNGTVNANSQSTTVTFEYGTTTSYGQTAIAAPSPVTGSSTTNITANITGLTKNTTYHYRTKAVSAGGTVYGGDITFTTTNVQALVEMVLVTGGSFTMGCGTGQSGCSGDESPTHTVTLSSFYMGKYEVTQQQYLTVMGSNPSYFTGDLSRPAEQMTWYNAVDFCNKLSTLEGYTPYYNINGTTITINSGANGYRLPTEAEWEYAARGGTHYTDYYTYSGSSTIDGVAWYTTNSGSTTHAVGTKTANQLGIYDLTGNVWEWCYDWYGSYSSGSQTNPTGATSGSYRVGRGGSWNLSSTYCRIASRGYINPTGSSYVIGFRLVRTF